MKIGIDASRFNLKSGTGVELYSVKIIQAFIDHFKHDTEHTLILYSPRKLMLYKTQRIQHRVIPMKRLWTKVRLSMEMLFHKPDVLFVPSHVLPHFAPKKSVIMIHDVAFMHQKKVYSKFQYWYLKKTTRYAVRKASDILVPSDATKRDLKHFFKCPEKKIHVIPHGFDFKPKSLGVEFEGEVLNNMNLQRRDNYMLFVGRLEAKKNINRIIDAFMGFSEKFPTWKLVLAGMRGVGFNKILKKAIKKDIFKNVIMPGYVTENEKHVLLKYCNAFIFPSLYEGFGFPILEAFAYKKPVITARSTSIPEVAGEAVIYVDALSTSSIRQGMEKLITNPKLKEETLRRQPGQLSKFKWEDAAAKTIEVVLG